ncbi:MAG: EamA family transporter [Burkholderiaceae bacterium]|nr:EamA family transporter [Burkholderiaceae bacterium]
MSNIKAFTRADYACALGVVVIWGVNFAVMKYALLEITPMLLGLLRFVWAGLPALVVKRPAVPWRYIVAYGLAQGVGQFGILFVAIAAGMGAGIASLVLQTQAFFTLILAAVVLGERAQRAQWLGLILATGGLGLIAASHGAGPDQMTLLGFVLTIVAAFMWATSNLIVRHASNVAPGYDALGFVVWTSLVAAPSFLVLVAWVDGFDVAWPMLTQMSVVGWTASAYLGVASTLIGYTMWTALLKRHAPGRVAPFSLLVPVVGLATAAAAFGEWLTPLQWLGAVGVLLGLIVNQFGASVFRRWFA